MMKHLFGEEGKGSRCSPVMGSVLSDGSYSWCICSQQVTSTTQTLRLHATKYLFVAVRIIVLVYPPGANYTPHTHDV